MKLNIQLARKVFACIDNTTLNATDNEQSVVTQVPNAGAVPVAPEPTSVPDTPDDLPF